jgi:CheY-like chemotaxis protein
MAKPTVLIVEDESLVLEVAACEFEDAGYDVLTAANADAALAQLDGDATIDLLFTDIRIPGALDGWDIAAHARSLRPQIPVIYATGYSGPATPQAVAGALLFRKPYRLSEILSAAQRLI